MIRVERIIKGIFHAFNIKKKNNNSAPFSKRKEYNYAYFYWCEMKISKVYFYATVCKFRCFARRLAA